MAIQDIFNSQIGAQYMLNPQSDYDPTQSNVMGESLSPTPPDNGASISVDSANDDRTALDYKMQAQLAKRDTASLYEDDDHSFVSDGGNHYDKVSNTRVDQMVNAAAAFAANYLATGNAGKAALMAGQAVNDMDAKEKRYKMINELEQKNYASIDIRKWVETGDDKDLLTNKGKFVNVMPGVMMNNLTGEVKSFNVAGANTPNNGFQMGLQTINGVDYMGAPNAKGQIEIKPATKEQREMYGTPAASGGSIGLDEDEENQNSGFVFENGQWVQHTTYANGRPKTVVANAAQQKALNAREAAKTPDASSTQMSGDLALLSDAVNNGKVGTFTGQVVGRLPDSAQDVYNSVNGDATERAAYQAANRIEGNMQNMGIAAATNMGASGINTEAEAERYFKSMPRLDKSSPEALKASVEAIQKYTNNYNAAKAEEAGVKPQPQPQAAAPAGNAPAGAVQALKANPQLAAQFKAKYGYLPEGF